MHRAALLLAAAALLTGCSGGSSPSAQHVSTTRHASPQQEAARDAQDLLMHARVPPSATAKRTAPTSRLNVPFERPAESSLVDRHQFWQIDMTVDATAAWIRSHPPVGFTLTGSGNGGGPAFQDVQFAYEPTHRRADGALRQLQLVVTNLSASSSGIRADGLAEWLDPRPLRDAAVGRRIHLRADGSCASSIAGIVGVTNTGSDLTKALLPRATPERGRVCVYDGLNGHPKFRLAAQHVLTALQAQRLATAALSLPLSHPDDSVTGCPADDASAAVIALRYPDGRDIDLWADGAGCAYVRNGKIIARGTLPHLR